MGRPMNLARPGGREALLIAIRRAGPGGISRSWLVSDYGRAAVVDAALAELILLGLVEVVRPPRRPRQFGIIPTSYRAITPTPGDR